jgi:hypothetical protein
MAGVHGFGVPLTSFVGRAAEVAEVSAMLEKHRLAGETPARWRNTGS